MSQSDFVQKKGRQKKEIFKDVSLRWKTIDRPWQECWASIQLKKISNQCQTALVIWEA